MMSKVALVVLLLANLLQDGRSAPSHPEADEEENRLITEVSASLSNYIDYKVRSLMSDYLKETKEECACENAKQNTSDERVRGSTENANFDMDRKNPTAMKEQTNEVVTSTFLPTVGQEGSGFKHEEIPSTTTEGVPIETIKQVTTSSSTGKNGGDYENEEIPSTTTEFETGDSIKTIEELTLVMTSTDSSSTGGDFTNQVSSTSIESGGSRTWKIEGTTQEEENDAIFNTISDQRESTTPSNKEEITFEEDRENRSTTTADTSWNWDENERAWFEEGVSTTEILLPDEEHSRPETHEGQVKWTAPPQSKPTTNPKPEATSRWIDGGLTVEDQLVVTSCSTLDPKLGPTTELLPSETSGDVGKETVPSTSLEEETTTMKTDGDHWMKPSNLAGENEEDSKSEREEFDPRDLLMWSIRKEDDLETGPPNKELITSPTDDTTQEMITVDSSRTTPDFLRTLQALYEDKTCDVRKTIELCKCDDIITPIGGSENKIYLAENAETPDVQELYVPLLKIFKKDKSFQLTDYVKKLLA